MLPYTPYGVVWVAGIGPVECTVECTVEWTVSRKHHRNCPARNGGHCNKDSPAPNAARINEILLPFNAARGNRNPPAHNPARGNINLLAPNAARINDILPPFNAARGNRNPPAHSPACGNRNPPAHNPACGNRNPPAHNPARGNRNPPAHNPARGNRNPPAHNPACGNRNPPAHNPARGNRNPPAHNPARGNRNPPAHNPARGNRNPPAHNPARNNGVSPMDDIARKLDLHAAQGRTLYFAYGSNIHVSQMAERCPRSLFVGAATLPGHRWQINQRGVANIVPSPNHRVEGLVYLVDREDEKSLDRSEGIKTDLYEKQLRDVDLTPHPTLYTQKSSLVAAELARQRQPGQGNNAFGLRRGGLNQPQVQQELRPGQVKALVYISEKYKTDGAIRSEYIPRMQKAMEDGLKLGMSASYIQGCMDPLVNLRRRR